MQRIPFNLRSVRAARELRAGKSPQVVAREYGLSDRNLMRIDTTYSSVPDMLLTRIERLLGDREKLQGMISTLLTQGDFVDF